MMIDTDELIVYRSLEHKDILDDVTAAVSGCEDAQKRLFNAAGRLVQLAGIYGFRGNLWHDYLTLLLVNSENAFSTACELRGMSDGTLRRLAVHDFMIFRELFTLDLTGAPVFDLISDYHGEEDAGTAFNKRISD